MCNLRRSAVSTFRGITRRELVRKNRLLTTSHMFCSPVNDDHTTFPADVETVTFVGRAVFARLGSATPRTASTLGSHLRCVFSVSLFMPHPLTAITSPCPYYLGCRRTRRPVRLSFGSYLLVYALKSTHIVALIHPACPTSAPYSRYSPNMASRPSSHCTRMSGRATPAGPAQSHGRLSR